MTRETDILVIGAGAAGLAAASALRVADANFLVIEASGRRGGRAWTDHETFPGVPFDRGCHWLHSASVNPLRAEAERLGFRYDADFSFDDRIYYEQGRLLGEAERARIETAYGPVIDGVVDLPPDASAADALDADDPFYPMFDHIFALITSHPAERVSALDFARAAPSPDNYPMVDGLGALVLKLAEQVPVELETPTTRIDRTGARLRVETPRGAIAARAVILTVSTGVLASGAIAFEPALPASILSAIEACPVGCCERVGLLLDQPLEEVPPGATVRADDATATPRRPISFYAYAAEPTLATAIIGGRYADALVAEGEAAIIDYAMSELVKICGSGVRGRVRTASASGWRHDPWIRGAYSCALPGRADERAVLATLFDERLFLAGEAVSPDHYATCHGAHMTGLDAVRRALASIQSDL